MIRAFSSATATLPAEMQPYERPGDAVDLPVPVWLVRALDAAWGRGVELAASGAAPAANTSSRDAIAQGFERWAIDTFPARPPLLADTQELRYMRLVARGRSAPHTVQARWLANDGDRTVWARALRDWQATVGPRQAQWGAELLENARSINKTINDAVKEKFGRTRPYNADKNLATAVPRSSASSPSYPSGHTARAFLDATVLSHLMPTRRAEFMRLAYQMAMARIYGGVHYPSDTVGGAYEGGLIATWAVRNAPPRPAG